MRLGRQPPSGERLQARQDVNPNSGSPSGHASRASLVRTATARTVDLGELRKITSRIQDVVVEPGAWSGILEEISAAAGAQCASLFLASASTSDVVLVSGSPNSEPISERYLRDGWFRRDIRVRAIPKMLRTGVGVDQDFITPQAMEREPYYQDFLAAFGLRWWAGVAFRSSDDLWCMAIQRSIKQGHFDPEEQTKLATLCQSLTEAASISRAVGRARIVGVTDALGLVGQPALVLDHFGRVLRENAAAACLYDPWFRVAGARILAQDHEAASAFIRLAEACRSPHPLSVSGKRIVVRRGERRPIVVYPHALSGAAVEPFSGGRVLLLLTDLEAKSQPAASVLIAAFGLTDAEARLAVILCGGGSLELACETLHMARETGRNHLKSIFAKTNTHRQAELVLLLARLSTAFPPRSY